MKINLATLLQSYRFTHPEDHHFEPTYVFNTRPKNGLPLLVEARTQL